MGRRTKSLQRTDEIIGQNIRTARLQRGLSQTKLANAIGVTFQQVQKYEKGTNRCSGSRLEQVARLLGLTPGDLFPARDGATSPVTTHTMLIERVGMDVLQAWERMTKPQRAAMRDVIVAVADAN